MLPASTKTYLAQALWQWCVDRGLTPYLTARVAGSTVPKGYDHDGQIVLNLHPEAVNALHFEEDGVGFQARFSGKVFDVWIPRDNILSIVAKETGHGIALPNEMFAAPEPFAEGESDETSAGGGFKRVK